MIDHINDHADGCSDDDLKGSARGDGLSGSLVPPCPPPPDRITPRVTLKGVILLTEGLMALVNTRPDYDPAANKPPFFTPLCRSAGLNRSPLLPVFTDGCRFDSLILHNYWLSRSSLAMWNKETRRCKLHLRGWWAPRGRRFRTENVSESWRLGNHWWPFALFHLGPFLVDLQPHRPQQSPTASVLSRSEPDWAFFVLFSVRIFKSFIADDISESWDWDYFRNNQQTPFIRSAKHGDI